MFRPWFVGLLAASAAFLLSRRPSRPIPASVAAERLRQAWADHHTVA